MAKHPEPKRDESKLGPNGYPTLKTPGLGPNGIRLHQPYKQMHGAPPVVMNEGAK